MIEEQRIKDLPFDAEGGAGLYGHKPHVMHVSPPRYMTTRASLFLAFAVIGLGMALMTDLNIFIPVGCAVALTLIWCLTFRFVKTPVIAPVVAVVMTLPECAAGYYLDSMYLASSLSVFSLGLVSLSAVGTDDDSGSRPHVFKEITVPLFFAVCASLTGYYVSLLFESRFLFIGIIISVSFLILTSIIISKSSGSRFFFTSKHLTEFWDIPVAEFSQTRIFIIAKAKFIMTTSFLFASLYALDHFVAGDFKNHMMLPASMLIALPFVYIIPRTGKDHTSSFGTKHFIYEAFIAAALISMFYIRYGEDMSISKIVYAFLLLNGTDIIGSALLAVIRRRQIFVSRSKYIDGTSFMMTMFALLIMLVECCLYNAV